jgi:hypothetical protein
MAQAGTQHGRSMVHISHAEIKLSRPLPRKAQCPNHEENANNDRVKGQCCRWHIQTRCGAGAMQRAHSAVGTSYVTITRLIVMRLSRTKNNFGAKTAVCTCLFQIQATRRLPYTLRAWCEADLQRVPGAPLHATAQGGPAPARDVAHCRVTEYQPCGQHGRSLPKCAPGVQQPRCGRVAW